VLAFDWNASGLTTILTAALKEAIRGAEKDLGIFICGGKGKTSLKTPEQILNWSYRIALPEESANALVYNSKMAAKVDSSLVQDGFQIYHHSFCFSKNGAWTVVQQGMNAAEQSARRYHWYSKDFRERIPEQSQFSGANAGNIRGSRSEPDAVGIVSDEERRRLPAFARPEGSQKIDDFCVAPHRRIKVDASSRHRALKSSNFLASKADFAPVSAPFDLIEEPHSGITSNVTVRNILNMTSADSGQNRGISTELVSQSFNTLMKDITLLRKYYTPVSQMAKIQLGSKEQLTLLNLETKEFKWHPVVREDFSKSKYLEKILWRLCDNQPDNYEKLLATPGVGPKTIRALALVAEVIYGAKPSYEDPARYSFAHGGKDATPYPVDQQTYDQTIAKLKSFIK
jgi:hypothetical protein